MGLSQVERPESSEGPVGASVFATPGRDAVERQVVDQGERQHSIADRDIGSFQPVPSGNDTSAAA